MRKKIYESKSSGAAQRRLEHRIVDTSAIEEEQKKIEVLNSYASIKRDDFRAKGGLERALKLYFPDIFISEFSNTHKKVIDGLHKTMMNGGSGCVAMSRGSGKSSIAKASAVIGLLEGWRSYLVYVAATAKQSVSIIDFVRESLLHNEKLRNDYPILASWMTRSEGKAAVAKILRDRNGEDTGFRLEKERIILPEIIGQSWSGGIVECKSMTGAIRGLQHLRKDGSIIRPDYCLIDDPQTAKSADSQNMTEKRWQTITGDIQGLSGPNTRIAMYATVTVIRDGDLACKMLESDIWESTKSSLIVKWPTNLDTLWSDYEKIFRYGDAETPREREELAKEFYLSNQTEMDAGSEVFWSGFTKEGEVSPIQSAMNCLYRFGHEMFASEYQNEPIKQDQSSYDLTPELIKTRLSGLPRLHLPVSANIITVGADINDYGIHWVAVGFDQSQSGTIAAYGCFTDGRAVLVEKNASQIQKAQAVFTGLVNLFDELQKLVLIRDGKQAKIDMAIIDSGYFSEVVHRFASSYKATFQVAPSKGFAASRYWPSKNLVGKPGVQSHVAKMTEGKLIALNSDYWKETTQRAWLPIAGSPGGLTVYSDKRTNHNEFANQIAAERLIDKGTGTNGSQFYKWSSKPGEKHDYGDAIVYAYVGSSHLGIAPGGLAKQMISNSNGNSTNSSSQIPVKKKKRYGVSYQSI